MSSVSDVPPSKKSDGIAGGILARSAQVGSVFLVQGLILFGAAGRLDWVWAWVFLGIYLVSVLINSLFLMRNSPETIAERGRASGAKDWDKIVSGWWSVFQFLIIPLVAGLDMRFGWSQDYPIGWQLAGALLFAAGLGLFSWAMITNAYFSTVVRIQSERGQSVCRSGPYRVVRHPGYTGTILQSIGMALLLGSPRALIPGLIAAALMVVRTFLEDRMLQTELPGYTDFVREVRYRLVPAIW